MEGRGSGELLTGGLWEWESRWLCVISRYPWDGRMS